MANTMIDSIMGIVTPQVTSALASRLGGSATAVQSGLGTVIAALVGGLANRTGDSGLMSQIFQLISGSNTQGVLSSLPSLASGTGGGPVAEQGSKLTSMLFGGQQSAIENLIGRQSGLGAGAGSALMSTAAPLLTGFLGQQIRERGLSLSSFSSLISAEGSKIQSMLPAGLGSLLSAAAISPSASSLVSSSANDSGKKGLWLVLLAIVVLALFAWLVSRGCNKTSRAAAPAEIATPAPAPAPAAGPLGEFIRRKLPDGTELNIPRQGVENKLLDFIENSSRPVDKNTWFDFDRLTFNTGAATLQDSSAEQLQNIAAILKAYPKVKMKIGGYTDNTGDKGGNLKLSQARATNVVNELVKLGTDKSRLQVQGYGEEHPVADNSTEEGRAKNRRISLRVTEK